MLPHDPADPNRVAYSSHSHRFDYPEDIPAALEWTILGAVGVVVVLGLWKLVELLILLGAAIAEPIVKAL